jgi:hypothetical protein
LLFPVERPEFFDAVVLGPEDQVREIQVKQQNASSNWIWGAFKMPGHVFCALREMWFRRECADEYVGTLVNAYLAAGGQALGVKAGEAYVDIGTLNGYRTAIGLLAEMARESDSAAPMGWPAGHSGPLLRNQAGAQL